MANKRRGKIPSYLQQPYEPEYKRLNKEPVSMYSENSNKPNASTVQSNHPAKFRRASENFRPPPQSVPPQMGQTDNGWFAEEVAGPPKQPNTPQVVDNNEKINVDALQGMDPLNPENNAPPPVKTAEPQQESEQMEVEEESEGKYIIFYGGEGIYSSDNEEHLKEVIEDLLLNRNVKLEDLEVFKKIDIDFGVVLK